MKITTGTAYTERDIAAEQEFLAVPWSILDDTDTMLLEGVQAFPLLATSEEVNDFLNRKLATYKENVALHEGAKELQAGLDNAGEVAATISNLEVTE